MLLFFIALVELKDRHSILRNLTSVPDFVTFDVNSKLDPLFSTSMLHDVDILYSYIVLHFCFIHTNSDS